MNIFIYIYIFSSFLGNMHIFIIFISLFIYLQHLKNLFVDYVYLSYLWIFKIFMFFQSKAKVIFFYFIFLKS